MCMMIYVASDSPLPRSEWDESRPGFYAKDLCERGESVRCQFAKSHVYCAASHQVCGCGFDLGVFESGLSEDETEHADAPESRRRLAEFLTLGLERRGELEFYACWDGNQVRESAFRGQISPDELF